jgi:hypothetical protein
MENSSSTSSFKYYCKALLAGVSAFLSLNLMLAYGMHRMDAQDEIGRSLSDGRYDPIQADVLFIGDSRTHQGLDPEVFSAEIAKRGDRLTALNLAAPGMQGPFYYFVLKDYLDHTPVSPRAIVANISFYMLGGAQWFQDIYMAYYTPNMGQALDAVRSRLLLPADALNWYVRTRIPALRYNKSFAGLIDTFAADPMLGLATTRDAVASVMGRIQDISKRGYLSSGEHSITADDMKAVNYDVYAIGFHNGYSVYLDYFKRFFDLAADRHIHVFVYPFPWPEKADGSQVFHKVYDFYERMIKSLAQGNPYVHFVEYNHFWTPDYFVDPLHVNQKGAERLSRMAACWVLSEQISSAKVGIAPLASISCDGEGTRHARNPRMR